MPDVPSGLPAAAGAGFGVRRMLPADLPRLESLIRSVESFNPHETAVALELVQLAAGPPPGSTDYRVLVAETHPAEPLAGYACFGPTPMTRDTFDLYWIAVPPAFRRRGVGRAIHEAVVASIREARGRRVRVETSSKENYGPTQRFYERAGYAQVGQVPDFYSEGDDLLILVKDLGA